MGYNRKVGFACKVSTRTSGTRKRKKSTKKLLGTKPWIPVGYNTALACEDSAATTKYPRGGRVAWVFCHPGAMIPDRNFKRKTEMLPSKMNAGRDRIFQPWEEDKQGKELN